MMFFNYLRADFIKTKHTPVRLAHLIIPLVMAFSFLAYYSFSPWSREMKISAFYEAVGIGFPILTGIFGASIAEQEQNTGSYFHLLAARSKIMPFVSKLILLLLMGLGSVMLTTLLFGVGFSGNRFAGLIFYIKAGLIMWGSSIPMYIWHLFLAFRFNKGVTIGLGIADGLVSALFLTGLGDGIWRCVPASWTGRIPATWILANSGNTVAAADLQGILFICCVVTVAALLLYVVWSSRWEGSKMAE